MFYDAIRGRRYFATIQVDTKNPILVVKKLRYFARFMVVAMLLEKRSVVTELLTSLTELISEYTKVFKAADSQEWQLVLQEIKTFLAADEPVALSFPDNGEAFAPSHRIAPSPLTALVLPSTLGSSKSLKLSEAILVGNSQTQVKFSELTLDMFRLLQALERQTVIPSGRTSIGDGPSSTPKFINPHKCLLYRPNLAQLLVFVATAFKEMAENTALLLYISADGGDTHNGGVSEASDDSIPPASAASSGATAASPPPPAAAAASAKPHTGGGLVLNARTPVVASDKNPVPAHYLYPEDLIAFTRKPLFLIVDSDNARSFQRIQTPYQAPYLCLMSPTSHPPGLADPSTTGSLFTLFLHDPITAFCVVTGQRKISSTAYTRGQAILSRSAITLHNHLASRTDIPPAFLQFMEDDFLRVLICRFVFAATVFAAHKEYASVGSLQPTSSPSFPPGFFRETSINKLVGEIAVELEATPHFNLSEKMLADIKTQRMARRGSGLGPSTTSPTK